jgi:hypothetical protein
VKLGELSREGEREMRERERSQTPVRSCVKNMEVSVCNESGPVLILDVPLASAMKMMS